ncbi:MAG: RNA polymerase subunit sigma-70 [Dermatophilaceae bacterium]
MDTIPDPSNPTEALAAVVSLRRLAERLEAASVQAAIDQGWTWLHIAQALGVTKQAVHKKYAKRVQRSTPL